MFSAHADEKLGLFHMTNTPICRNVSHLANLIQHEPDPDDVVDSWDSTAAGIAGAMGDTAGVDESGDRDVVEPWEVVLCDRTE